MEIDDETSGPMIDDEIYANGVYGDDEKCSRPIINKHQTMELEALRMAYDEIKKGENTQLHREVVQKIGGRLRPEYGMDVAWCDAVDRRAEQKKEKLENELNAYRFLETGLELGNHYNEVIAPQDVATYGGLCALATFDRMELKAYILSFLSTISPFDLLGFFFCSEVQHSFSVNDFILQNKVIENLNFKNFLELVPEVRELINDFYTRIDSHNKILYARHADQRNATFQRVLQTGNEFDHDVKSMLLRVNLIKHEYNLRAARKH
ncbi:hypothetical protein C1H46_017720 [Malus baccata]|uniref:Uncharacterized protein n=1 Tax=Malus baccata TaxID=106549 RepID=A0A540MD70_MALBA|nr:hypothetical protein C1H46_017720 [Malus baccata]